MYVYGVPAVITVVDHDRVYARWNITSDRHKRTGPHWGTHVIMGGNVSMVLVGKGTLIERISQGTHSACPMWRSFRLHNLAFRADLGMCLFYGLWSYLAHHIVYIFIIDTRV